MSCIGTVIPNYFKISYASYMPSVILYEFIYNLRIVASETRHVLLQNRAWRIVSRPPGNVFYCWCACNSIAMTPTHRFLCCQTWLKKFSLQNSNILNSGILICISIKTSKSFENYTRMYKGGGKCKRKAWLQYMKQIIKNLNCRTYEKLE